MRTCDRRHILVSSVCLVCLGLLAGCGDNSASIVDNSARKTFEFAVVEQLRLEHNASLPIVLADGFIVADQMGNVRRFNQTYKQLWSVTHKGMDFSGGGTAANGRLFLGSDEGAVFCMRVDDGSTLWTNALDAVFLYPPLCGNVEDQSRLWLLGASDGVIHSLDAVNGNLLWKSPATNRSDGGMVRWKQRLIYGNCDGAAHIFDAANGAKIASVAVGESDQMAAAPVVSDDGSLLIGTRQGNLAVVDIQRANLRSTLKISTREAFAVPALCGANSVACGIQEGDILMIELMDGVPVVKAKYAAEHEVDFLLYERGVLYALANGDLMAFDRNLQLICALNVGDTLSGVKNIGSGILAVKADNALLFIRGEWQ